MMTTVRIDDDIPVIYTPEVHDVFFYDGQRFHHNPPHGELEPKCKLGARAVVDPSGAEKYYFCVEVENGPRGPIGYCCTNLCHGHTNTQEAYTHYIEYLFEMMTLGTYLLSLDKEGYCAVCHKKTRGYGEIETLYFQQSWFLCETHRSAECLKKRFRYDIWSGHIFLFIEPYARFRKKARR